MTDVIARLKVESKEYDAKIERARSGLLKLEDSLRKAGKTMADADKDQVAYVRSLGNMETVARTTRGKLSELTKAFTDLKLQYKAMTDAEKQSPIGQALSQSLDTLKARIIDTKKNLNDVSAELGETKMKGADLSGVMSTLGSKFGINGELLKAVTSGTIGYAAAITGLTTATIAAVKAFSDYNSKLNQQQNITTVTTGLQGPDANRMTASARSVADVYGVDFREVINAANTLMTQFGSSGEEAMMLIRDGMQGMIMGDGPKLLSMIQQFAPSFRDAGISASQLVAIIHNSEGGIFTDQNMQAIVMGIRNIRLMTKQTSDALKNLGIDGEEMSRKMANGSMSIFEALKQVSEAIEKTGGSSQAAGEVMQAVFGRQATMAGSKLGEAIATLNTNLTETKNQTGELGGAFARLQKANERLEQTMMETFGYDGWTVMATDIKTGLVGALTDVVELTKEIKESWIGDIGSTIFDAVTQKIRLGIDLLKVMWGWQKKILGIGGAGGAASEGGTLGGSTMGNVLGNARGSNGTDPEGAPKDPKDAYIEQLEREIKELRGTGKPKPKLVEGGVKMKKEEEVLVTTITGTMESTAKLNEALAQYKRMMNTASDPYTYAAAAGGYQRTKAQLETRNEALQFGISPESLAGMKETMNTWMAETQKELPPLHVRAEFDTSKTKKQAAEMGENWKAAASAIQAVGSAMASIEDPAAKVMGTIAQAIATMALSYAQAAASPAVTGTGWGWIAFAATGLATMVSSIAAIKEATAGSYAEGGIIPGNNHNDGLIAHVSSGELILNRAQQGVIAGALTESGSGRSTSRQPYVSGEQIYLGLNNYLRRSNRGELVTSR